jgi:hypothetical protein
MTYFFGYGVYRDKQRLADIIGKQPKGGYGALLSDFVLTVQKLSLIPEKARKIIQQVWGDNFKAYTLKKGQGLVAGVVWELDDKDIEKIKAWEHIDVWREIKEVTVVTHDKKTLTAITEKAHEDGPISEIVDGLYYDNNLNKHGKKPPENDEYKIAFTRKLLEKISKGESNLGYSGAFETH